MAQKIMKVTHYEGGKEASMSAGGNFILFLGIVALISGIVAGGFITADSEYDDWAENGLDWTIVILGFAAFIQSLLAWLILSGGAEIIRLLKKLNGLDFDGSIAEVAPVSREECSECGEPADAYQKRCQKCKKEFEE